MSKDPLTAQIFPGVQKEEFFFTAAFCCVKKNTHLCVHDAPPRLGERRWKQEVSLGFLSEGHVALRGGGLLHGSLDWTPAPRGSARLAVAAEHLSVDLQGAATGLHVQDLTEAFGLFLQRGDRLEGGNV